MINIKYKRNCVYQTAYHVVWCSKYRKKVLVNKVFNRANELIDLICKENDWLVISKEVQPDHIHLFVSFPPVVSIATAMKKLKGITVRKLFLEYPTLKKCSMVDHFGHLLTMLVLQEKFLQKQ